ncbi:hypothetical protein X947_3801 [Burkholderia pseudomallei MSHR7334]|nr:hypothetical protein X947_3801 [Burkholderia pseudomallei MSHR7334]
MTVPINRLSNEYRRQTYCARCTRWLPVGEIGRASFPASPVHRRAASLYTHLLIDTRAGS